MAEKKVMEQVCPCGGHRAEVYVDVETKESRLDFVSVEDAGKKPKKPESESTIIGRVLLGE